MPNLQWQKSSYCQEASACVNVAATPDGTIHLRESETPDITLTTGPRQLHALIAQLKRHSTHVD
ncbi:DUF397 domain-containing protein [Streptomyces sp. PmtG]